LLLGVNSIIEFNGAATVGAAEVDDERSDGMLPTEFHSIQATTA